jgi:beta-lactamase class A
LILGVGIGTIAGTILSISDPATRQSELNPTEKKEVQASDTGGGVPSPISLAQDLPDLKAKIQGLLVADSKLQPGVFFVDLDTNSYLDLDGSVLFPAASTIKVPILVAFFQDVDAGKIRLDEMLTLEPEVIGSGSGDLQYKKVGTQYTALEVATKMIAISDNTATNMLITRLGGQEVLNERFRRWGLTATGIQNPLPDLEGTNTTSPKDLAMLMSMVNQGDLLSMRSRDRLLSIMNRTVNNSLLPKGLGDGATIAHKTGDIGSLIADVGLVDMPSGKRYIAVVMVRRPHNDASASELIRQISRTAYEFFSQPPSTTPSTTSTPTGRTATTSQNITAGNLL